MNVILCKKFVSIYVMINYWILQEYIIRVFCITLNKDMVVKIFIDKIK